MIKNVVININYFIAKYDFDVGNKLKPMASIRNFATIKMFSHNSIMELLQLCSFHLRRDEAQYSSLWMLDGTPITDLNDVPEDCQVLVCSTVPSAEEALFEDLAPRAH
jgi:hypothetical protein